VATTFAKQIPIFRAASHASFTPIFCIAASSIRRMHTYKQCIKGAALGFSLLNPITLDGCQLY